MTTRPAPVALPELALALGTAFGIYESTWESVDTYLLPDSYDDAKLDIFLHRGLYSVPGWAPQVPNVGEIRLESPCW